MGEIWGVLLIAWILAIVPWWVMKTVEVVRRGRERDEPGNTKFLWVWIGVFVVLLFAGRSGAPALVGLVILLTGGVLLWRAHRRRRVGTPPAS